MPSTPLYLVNNVLRRAFDDSIDVNPMKIQRLLYLTAVDYAQRTDGEPLLTEPFHAWDYGPVAHSTYDKLRCLEGNPVRRYLRDAGGRSRQTDEARHPVLRQSLDRVWAAARDRSAVELSNLIRIPGGAWHLAYGRASDDLIAQEDIVADAARVLERLTGERVLAATGSSRS